MPGEIPTSPTTAPPVQVTAVPPRTAKSAADPSDWADADETPPSSAAVASRDAARYFCRVIMICIPISRLREVFRSLRHRVPTTATIPLRRENFCPVADGVEKIKAVSRRPYRNSGAKARDEHDDDPHRTDVSQSEQQDSLRGRR